MLSEGDAAPDFTLPDQDGDEVELKDLRWASPCSATSIARGSSRLSEVERQREDEVDG